MFCETKREKLWTPKMTSKALNRNLLQKIEQNLQKAHQNDENGGWSTCPNWCKSNQIHGFVELIIFDPLR